MVMDLLVGSIVMGLGLVASQAPVTLPGAPPVSPAPAPTTTPAAPADPALAAPEPTRTETAPAPAPAPPPTPAAPPPVVTAPPANATSNPPDTRPVVRAGPGNWGMTFIFGGLSPISVAGLGDLPLANGLIFTEIGVRRVFKRVVVPFSFGAGVTRQQSTTGLKPAISAGVSASVAVLKGFRVWRRIAPYYGGFLHTHYVDSAGPDNWLVNLTIGPILGIEYYLGDRVSLYGQGIVGIGPTFGKDTIEFVARASLAAGGQLGLTFYF